MLVSCRRAISCNASHIPGSRRTLVRCPATTTLWITRDDEGDMRLRGARRGSADAMPVILSGNDDIATYEGLYTYYATYGSMWSALFRTDLHRGKGGLTTAR